MTMGFSLGLGCKDKPSTCSIGSKKKSKNTRAQNLSDENWGPRELTVVESVKLECMHVFQGPPGSTYSNQGSTYLGASTSTQDASRHSQELRVE